jgi:uncharacterized protein YbbC (DUF1343 family)/CubicO group peptidase (beta-lactamase class C family)
MLPKVAGLGCLLVWILGCQTVQAVPGAFRDEALDRIEKAIQQTIDSGGTPGAVFWLEHDGASWRRAFGQRAVEPKRLPAAPDTIYDMASLTKVMAATPAIMLLVEKGKIGLDDPVTRFIPEFGAKGKESITIRQLLTHTSGLRPDLSLDTPWSGYDKAIELACEESPRNQPGAKFVYSDINFFLLGEIVRRASGKPLNEFLEANLYRPLKMRDTGFLPPKAKLSRIAPTERFDGRILQGEVHDPTARRMGGVAGHAGLFSTASDTARYARMILNNGILDGKRVFKPETVRMMISVQSPAGVPDRRGLGWDIDSGYSRPRGAHFPLGSFGHTGWTGGAIWIDPFSKTFWVCLSNRVHPDGQGNVLDLWARLGTLAAEAIPDFNFDSVPGALSARAEKAVETRKPQPTATVLNGIDVLAKREFKPLRGLRIGLVTNHTGQDRTRVSTVDLLKNAPDVQLKAIFTPEHGLRGNKDETIDDSVDEKTGLPVHSLYGQTRRPKPEQLAELDALVYDIQDIGCRFYTYISTLNHCMEAAAAAGKKFFVLDRVNPINGIAVEGPMLDGAISFTACHPIPIRHGMTAGELARMFQKEKNMKVDLTVIPVEGWKRSLWFDQTGLPWIHPSPNMRSLAEAALYPGVGLLETTALSVGRGTDTPFELVGAPYINDVRLAAELNKSGIEGVRFIPVRFTPSSSVYKDKACGGVNVVLLDRERCHPILIGIAIAQTLHRLYPGDFKIDKFNALLAHPKTVQAIRSGASIKEISDSWASDIANFEIRRKPFLLY